MWPVLGGPLQKSRQDARPAGSTDGCSQRIAPLRNPADSARGIPPRPIRPSRPARRIRRICPLPASSPAGSARIHRIRASIGICRLRHPHAICKRNAGRRRSCFDVVTQTERRPENKPLFDRIVLVIWKGNGRERRSPMRRTANLWKQEAGKVGLWRQETGSKGNIARFQSHSLWLPASCFQRFA